MTGYVASSEDPGEALFIGYRPDRGIYDMFGRYYHGKLTPEYLYEGDPLDAALEAGRGVWVLTHEEGDDWESIEAVLAEHEAWKMGFQIEEHTLRGLREGLRQAHKYKSPLYRLYHVPPQHAGAVEATPPAAQ